MKLRKCGQCNIYTMNLNCPKCKKPTSDAHYKFVKFRDSKDSINTHRNVSVLIPKGTGGKIILARRAKNKLPFPDVWVCAAGGGIEKGETPKEAIMREMKEELGVSEEVEKVGEASYESKERNESLHIFTTKNVLDESKFTPDKREIQSLRSFPVRDIIQGIEKHPSEFAPTFIKVFYEFVRVNQTSVA